MFYYIFIFSIYSTVIILALFNYFFISKDNCALLVAIVSFAVINDNIALYKLESKLKNED